MKLKPGLDKEYASWEIRAKKSKGEKVLDSVLEVGRLLDSDFPIEVLIQEIVHELVLRLEVINFIRKEDVGYVALAVSKFHRRGDEFRRHWNKFWDNEEKAAELEKEKRVTSPYEKDE